MFSVGAAMAVGGVVQMLSPQVSGLRMRQDPDNKPSYAFGGPLIQQHPATPFLYLWSAGNRRAIISAGIYAEDQQ
jgi:predicted phage tail protein